MQEKQKKIIRWSSLVLILVTTVSVWYLNYLTDFMMDDEWYSTLLYSDTPIQNISDILHAQIWHYFNWGGRSMAHGLLQLILLCGEHWADIFNTIMTLLLSWLICKVSGRRGLPYFLAAMGMILGLNANWRMSMFWEAGAANYLYMAGFLLAYLYCYLHYEDRGERKLPGITLWILPLGLIAGWSNENMGPAVWIVSLLVMLFRRKDHKKIPVWMYLGNISCLAGSILMIAAPGNFVRSEETAENTRGLLWNLYLRCYSEAKGAFEYLFPTLVLTAVLLVICAGILKEKIGKENVLLLVGALLSWGAMILSPHYPDRASFGTMVLLICVILSLAGKAVDRQKENAWMYYVCGLFVWLRGMYFLMEYMGLFKGWIT